MADSGEWRKIVDYMRGTGVPFRAVSTYRPGAVTATGRPSRHGMGLAVDFAGPTASRDSNQLLRVNQAFKPIGYLLHELIYSGPGSYQVYNGQPYTYRGVTRDNHHDHVHVSIDYGTQLPGAKPLPTPTPIPKPQENEMQFADFQVIEPGQQKLVTWPQLGWNGTVSGTLALGGGPSTSQAGVVVGGEAGESINQAGIAVGKGGRSALFPLTAADTYAFVTNEGQAPLLCYVETRNA